MPVPQDLRRTEIVIRGLPSRMAARTVRGTTLPRRLLASLSTDADPACDVRQQLARECADAQAAATAVASDPATVAAVHRAQFVQGVLAAATACAARKAKRTRQLEAASAPAATQALPAPLTKVARRAAAVSSLMLWIDERTAARQIAGAPPAPCATGDAVPARLHDTDAAAAMAIERARLCVREAQRVAGVRRGKRLREDSAERRDVRGDGGARRPRRAPNELVRVQAGGEHERNAAVWDAAVRKRARETREGEGTEHEPKRQRGEGDVTR